jgi:hypothetical protein
MDEATVVERGEKVRVWFVPEGDTWVRAADHPEAVVEMASSERGDGSCPPGTIWQRTVELSLPHGAALLSRTTTPAQVQLEPMEYLTRGQLGMRRRVHETWMRVAGNYRLERMAGAPSAYLAAPRTPED